MTLLLAAAGVPTGPVSIDIGKQSDEEPVYSEHTSAFFKHTRVYRIADKKLNTLVYLAISDSIVNG